MYIICGLLTSNFVNTDAGHRMELPNLQLSFQTYDGATKEELIDEIKRLERHVIQLKNVIAKSQVYNKISQ